MIIHTLYELDDKGVMRDSNNLVLRWRDKIGDEWVRREKM